MANPPPAAVLIKKACNIKSGSGVPNKTKVATISKAKVQEIAEMCVELLTRESLSTKPPLVCLPVTYACGGTTREHTASLKEDAETMEIT